MNFYSNVWLGFLKVQFNFGELDRQLAQCVEENINRSMSYLVLQSGICVQNDSIWEKSWASIDPKFPQLKNFFEQ